MIAAVYENQVRLRRYVLIALCSALFIGCAQINFTASPDPNSRNRFLEQIDMNGVLTWAVLPASYNSHNPTPWIVYNHGFGQTIISIVTDPPHSAFVQSLATAGFVIVASEYRNPYCWGNTECAEDIANLQSLWRSKLNLSPAPFVIGESMGGIVAWNAISRGTLKPLAVIGIYPVCNLADMYTNNGFVPTIQSAYGFSTPSGYLAATHGFDPMIDPPSIFAGIPIQIWASYSDRLVVRSRNADPFAKAINAAGGSVTIHTTQGDHGDPSNFDAAAVISFFSSVLTGAP
jgi:alpha-beta hydrolase superfamily lysophospholipase